MRYGIIYGVVLRPKKGFSEPEVLGEQVLAFWRFQSVSCQSASFGQSTRFGSHHDRIRMRTFFSLFAFAFLVSVAAPSMADPSSEPYNSITITFREMGIPVDAPFTKFTANINFDPAKPTAGSVQFSIDIASLDLGNPEYTKAVLTPDWFDAARYPTATFVSTSVRIVSPTELETSGKITIKGQTQDITFSVKSLRVGQTTSYDAVVHIDRTLFGIGTAESLGTQLVANDVAIKVHAAQSLPDHLSVDHGQD